MERFKAMHVFATCADVKGWWGEAAPEAPYETVAHRQFCTCTPRDERGPRWERHDFNRRIELCYCCGAEKLTSGSRWSCGSARSARPARWRCGSVTASSSPSAAIR